MLTLLRPYHINSNKREVKAPKVFIRDSGLLFRLAHTDVQTVEFSPLLGVAFEGFVVELIFRYTKRAKLTTAMKLAKEHLTGDHLFVVIPIQTPSFAINEGVTCVYVGERFHALEALLDAL